jgi:hypothetical protein
MASRTRRRPGQWLSVPRGLAKRTPHQDSGEQARKGRGSRRSGGSAAGCAESEYVQAVAVRLEALGVGELADGLGCLLLEGCRERDVDDFAAVHAEQVVVVLGEVLGKLEPGELVARGNATDEPGGVQVGQMPVGGAAGQAGETLGDVTDAHRMAGADKQIDNGAPAAGIALVDQAQAALDDTVHVIGYLLS